jgi:hypothetical protein
VTDVRWVREIEVEGKIYTATFIKRPFREGIEVRIETPWGVISVAELGLGEQALLEKAQALIEAELHRRP